MKNQDNQNGIIEAPVETDKIKKVYDNIFSKIYFLFAFMEKKAHMRGIELAQIKPDDKVLEVAVGIGLSFIEILKRVDSKNVVYGIDLSPEMVEKTRKLATKKGYTNFDLKEGDARHLPFPDDSFDVLFSNYMLDLIQIADFSAVIKEFNRVLKKDGRLALVNLSKKDSSPVLYEKLYKLSPYFAGGCRPVLMESYVKQAGFRNVKREFLGGLIPTEIVIGLKFAMFNGRGERI
ncbi:class I SAM-dependent methyltransferase [bacterium]|nr:class I SAM-dependent methyltransferase [bacterium]MBU4361591.1 class I SAM-dependent methyltransferase [bacterium]MBU4602483.1 class I SAM-dependent methyltransferase [bacterium]